MKRGQDTKPSGPGPEDALLHGAQKPRLPKRTRKSGSQRTQVAMAAPSTAAEPDWSPFQEGERDAANIPHRRQSAPNSQVWKLRDHSELPQELVPQQRAEGWLPAIQG